jgi:hypothetical protein
MSEQPNPGEVAPAPDPVPAPEPETTPPGTTPQDLPKTDDSAAPAGFIEQKRFTGAIQKIQTLTEELRAKDQEAAALNSQIEQLKQQQAVKDAEVQAGYGERDKKLEAALKEKQEIATQASQLQGKLRKIDMAKEMGHPELVSIIDTIPTYEDDELQKKAIEDIIRFTDERVKAREESLLAGITPSVSSTPSPGDSKPATSEGWKALIDAEPTPSKRQALQDEWWDWLQKNPGK